MSKYYILDGKTPVVEPDLKKWCVWMEAHQGEQIVRQDFVTPKDADGLLEDVYVSTVFLAFDHNVFNDSGPPLLFETMVFGGPHDQEQRRCTTWEEAEQIHAEMIALVKQGETHE